jgi:hypothetical protein
VPVAAGSDSGPAGIDVRALPASCCHHVSVSSSSGRDAAACGVAAHAVAEGIASTSQRTGGLISGLSAIAKA